MMKFIRHYLGWRNWAVLRFNSVLENIYVLFYIALNDRLTAPMFLANGAVFILLSIFSTTYGYLVNDWADKELDARHGKDNTFRHDSAAKAGLITGFFGRWVLYAFCVLFLIPMSRRFGCSGFSSRQRTGSSRCA